MRTNEETRKSRVCGCGRNKPPSYSFCIVRYKELPQGIQERLRPPNSFEERDAAYAEAVAFLRPVWDRQGTAPRRRVVPVTFTEDQLNNLFLSANIEGKRVAIQALLKWESEVNDA